MASENATSQAIDTHHDRNETFDKLGDIAGSPNMALNSSSPPKEDRRMSREWDASKVPPSQFQKRKGSIYSTPGSRDGHVKGSTRDQAYHDKLKEKGWAK